MGIKAGRKCEADEYAIMVYALCFSDRKRIRLAYVIAASYIFEEHDSDPNVESPHDFKHDLRSQYTRDMMIDTPYARVGSEIV